MVKVSKRLIISIIIVLLTQSISGSCYSQENSDSDKHIKDIMQGVKEHPDKVLQLAASGNALAQTIAGYMYFSGWQVPKDDYTARTWFSLGALNGNKTSQYYMGIFSMTGRGGQQDIKKALMWFNLSAQQGYSDAQVELGNLYLLGIGVPKDYEQAKKWLTLALLQGNLEAQKGLDAVEASQALDHKQPEVSIKTEASHSLIRIEPDDFSCTSLNFSGMTSTKCHKN